MARRAAEAASDDQTVPARVLTQVIEFGAVEGGHLIVRAVRQLPELLTRKKVGRDVRSRPDW